MSNDTVIRVENLSKQYRIGSARGGYKTFRETLADAAKAPFQRLTSSLSTPGSAQSSTEDTIWALKDVSFEVKQGEVIGIIGRNGAGKTTLLKILSRITEPTKGRAELRGRVGSLLEVGTGFHPELTGHENVYMYGAILGMDRWEVTQKFDEIVAFAELEKFIETPVKRYSTGMYMRLAFAVAAHLEPEILLVDEVLAVGDIGFQKKCMGKMGSVASEGRTVLFVSHNIAAISSLCSNCILLEEGHLTKIGDTVSVVQKYQASIDIIRSIALEDRKDRRGSGDLTFTKLSFLGENNSLDGSNVISGQSVSIIIEYTTKKDANPLSNVHIDLRVVDFNGNYLFTCSTRYHDIYSQKIPYSGEFICSLPKLPMAPGLYRIDLWCSVRGEEADYVESAGRLVVMEGDFFGIGKLPQPEKHGAILIEHYWSFPKL